MNSADMIAPQRLAFADEAEDSTALRFEQFDAKAPHIFELMARIALRRLDAGATYISVKWLVECVRTDPSVTRDGRPVSIDNSFSALYARKLLEVYPELSGAIHLRKRHV